MKSYFTNCFRFNQIFNALGPSCLKVTVLLVNETCHFLLRKIEAPHILSATHVSSADFVCTRRLNKSCTTDLVKLKAK